MKRIAVLCLWTVVFLLVGSGHIAIAASFDCAKAASTVEKLICNVPRLSELDDQLSAQYKAVAGSATDKEAVKAEQRRWLKEQRNVCKDEACIANAYEARIAQLRGASGQSAPSSTPSMWAGKWELEDANQYADGVLEITPSGSGAVEFKVNATDGSHGGEISGKAQIQGNRATFLEEKTEDQEEQCKVVMTLEADTISIETTDCSQNFGLNVGADGTYKKGQQRKTLSLSDTGLLENETMEAKFKALVGVDYKLFLEVAQLITEEEDLDKIGAKVSSASVRGMYTIYECIVMATPDGKFMAALVHPNENPAPDIVRYYTDNPNFAKSLPATIDKWRERFADRKVMGIVVPPVPTPAAVTTPPPPPAAPAPKAAPPRAAATPEPSFKIKGLYLGMDIKTVPAILKQKFPAGQDFEVADMIAERQSVLVLHGVDGVVTIIACAPDSPNVVAIAFEKVAVDALFSAAGMEASEFAKTFVEAYQLPGMDISDDRQSWFYLSPDGYKVNITAAKQLIIVRTPNSSERKKSFD